MAALSVKLSQSGKQKHSIFRTKTILQSKTIPIESGWPFQASYVNRVRNCPNFRRSEGKRSRELFRQPAREPRFCVRARTQNAPSSHGVCRIEPAKNTANPRDGASFQCSFK